MRFFKVKMIYTLFLELRWLEVMLFHFFLQSKFLLTFTQLFHQAIAFLFIILKACFTEFILPFDCRLPDILVSLLFHLLSINENSKLFLCNFVINIHSIAELLLAFSDVLLSCHAIKQRSLTNGLADCDKLMFFAFLDVEIGVFQYWCFFESAVFSRTC